MQFRDAAMVLRLARRTLAALLLLCSVGVVAVLAQGYLYQRGPQRCDSFQSCLDRCNAKGGTGGTDVGCANVCGARNCINNPEQSGASGGRPGSSPEGAVPDRGGAMQNCRALPPGPEKRQCAERANPKGFKAKQSRCLDLAQKQGMAGKSPAKKDFMQSCMQGKATD